jgi:hypothetical protein
MRGPPALGALPSTPVQAALYERLEKPTAIQNPLRLALHTNIQEMNFAQVDKGTQSSIIESKQFL